MDASRAMSLLWWADPVDPLAVWAICPTAHAPYTLYWDDGASTRMAASSAPIRHTYSQPDQYLLVAITPQAATADVVVRGERADTVFTLDSDERTVTAALPPLPEPVLYQVDWGDGTVTKHDATDLSPAHTYRIGFGSPTITVTDVPARWTTRYTGPTISGVPRIVFRPDPSKRGIGRIDLAGLPPGVTLAMENNRDFKKAWSDPVDVGPDGTAAFDLTLWTWPSSDWWRWARVTWTDPDTHEPRQLTQHMRICEWTTDQYGHCACYQNQIPITIDWDTDHPYVITATAAPIPPGDYTISWGDGHTTPYTVREEQRLDATHDYGSNQCAWISITGPPGTGHRFVRPLPIQSIEDTDYGPVLWWAIETGEPGTVDPYRPVRIDPGDGRWPIIDTLAPSVDPQYKCGTGWNYAGGAGTWTSRISAPMTDEFEFTYTQYMDRGYGGTDYDIPPDRLTLSWQFVVGTVTDTSYTGSFTLAKTTAYPGDWYMEFRLGPGETLTDAGPHIITDLGDLWWRITGTVPVPGFDKLQFDIRVEPATKPPVFPLDVRTVPPSLPLS